MPSIENREIRAMLPLAADAQAGEQRTYIVEGYATTFDDPYLLFSIDGVDYYESVDRHALDDADMTDVIMQFDHHGRVFARVSNGTLSINADEHGLHIRADLSRTASARQMHEEIAAGLVTKMSWAFVVAEESYNSDTHTRTILKIKKVYDVSAVSIPANADTDISARNAFDGAIKAERAERLAKRAKALIALINIETEV